MKTGTVVKVSGPLVIAEGMRDANMFDVVRAGSYTHLDVYKRQLLKRNREKYMKYGRLI